MGNARLLESEGGAPGHPAETRAANERRILILAPTGNDARLTAQVLMQGRIEAQICEGVAEVCRGLDGQCAAIILAEETLMAASASLVAALARQPAWSDVPVIIITSGGEADQARLRRLAVFGPGSNVTLLERPFRPGTLLSAAEVALRSRMRQYLVRDLLQSVRSSEERYHHILTSISDAFIAVGADWRITYVNSSYLRLVAPLGLSSGDLLGGDFWKTLREFIDADAEARYRGAMAEQKPDSMDFFYRPLAIWLEIRIYPSPEALTIYLRDITERKNADAALLAARDAAEQANRAKDDFLAALSHELRTPLNPVLLIATEAASSEDTPPELRADFDMIAKNVMLEARLIDDLLDLTRITRGKLVLDARPTPLHGVLRDAIANVSSEMSEKQLTLTLNLAAGNPIVDGDPVRLQQVFWNILKNAVKFTGARGKIAVKTRSASAEGPLVVEITDTGAGMTPEELGRIFDAFAQGDHAGKDSPHRFGGLGLGLAISRTLLELHAGSIRASSPGPGKGSTFTVELPLAGPRPTSCP